MPLLGRAGEAPAGGRCRLLEPHRLLVFVGLLDPKCHQPAYLRPILGGVILAGKAVQLGGEKMPPDLPLLGPQRPHVLSVEYAAIGAGDDLADVLKLAPRRILARLELSTVGHLSCEPGSGVLAHSPDRLRRPFILPYMFTRVNKTVRLFTR